MTQEIVENDIVSNHTADANQFLTFTVADEEYGLDILKVQEIRGYTPATRLPNAPEHVVGVLNLRGTIVPLYDLRRMFNLPEMEYDQFAAIVVVVLGTKTTGLIVDRVSEVVSIPLSEIQPPPDVQGAVSANVISGMVRHDDKLVILLEAETLLGSDVEELALAA